MSAWVKLKNSASENFFVGVQRRDDSGTTLHSSERFTVNNSTWFVPPFIVLSKNDFITDSLSRALFINLFMLGLMWRVYTLTSLMGP